MPSLIYLLESDLNRAKEIINASNTTEFQIELISDFKELSDNIENTLPDALFIGFPMIKETENHPGFLKDFITFVYGDEIPIDEKLRLYEMGINRVVRWNENTPQVLLQFLKMYNYRYRELKPVIQKYITRGNLEGFQVKEILLNGILEKKNLILKIQDQDWYGKLRTFQGEVVEAACSGQVGIDAALCILQHPKGVFRLRGYAKTEEVSTTSVSSFALLVESGFESEAIEKFVSDLGIRNPIFKLTGDGVKGSITPEQQTLIELLGKYSDFRSLLWKSPYHVYKTLRLIDQLYRQGLISVDKETVDLHRFTEDDIEYFRKNFFISGVKEGRLIVLGFPTSGKSQLIKTLAGIHRADLKSVQSLDFTRIQLAKDMRINVFGISIDSYFQPMLQKLSMDIFACFFIVNYNHVDKIEYTRYLLHQFLANFPVPIVIGLTYIENDPDQAVAETRKNLNVPEEIEIVPLDPDDFHQIRQLFYHLKTVSSLEAES